MRPGRYKAGGWKRRVSALTSAQKLDAANANPSWVTFANQDTQAIQAAGTQACVRSVGQVGAGAVPSTVKVYVEFVLIANNNFPGQNYIGACVYQSYSQGAGRTQGQYITWSANGEFWQNGFNIPAGGPSWNLNDVLGIALDPATRNVWFSINNVWILSGNPATGANPAMQLPVVLTGTQGYGFVCEGIQVSPVPTTYNYHAAPLNLIYAPPAGFSAGF